jgi:hypothetical protein
MQLTEPKADVVKDLDSVRLAFPQTKIAEIMEYAILEIEQLRRDTQKQVASDLYAGVRR